MYYTFVGILFFIGLAMMVQHGIWNNLITLFSIVIAGMVAYGAHQPLVVMADEYTGGSYTYLLDFPILWGVFALTVGLLKELANLLSKNRVNFPDQVDNFGGAGIAAIGAYFLMAFSMSTLHAAPLSYDVLGGAFEYGFTVKEVQSNFGEASGITKPDVVWLRLCGSVLQDEAFGAQTTGVKNTTMPGFVPEFFIQQQGLHRKSFGELKESIVKR